MNERHFVFIKQGFYGSQPAKILGVIVIQKKGLIMKKLMFAALALSASIAAPASAATIFGSTIGGPTFNRPLSGFPPSGLSAVGTAVAYQVTAFTVSTSGSYTFLMTALTTNLDAFLGLHQNAFNPLSSLTNAIVYDDDSGPGSDSTFTANLLAGTSYFAIATGFANTDAGEYKLDINGPGSVILPGTPGAVPETSTWAMIIAGFGIVGGALRRRRRTLAIA